MAQPYYFTLCPEALSFALCYKFRLDFLRWCETFRKHECFCGGRGRSDSCSSSRAEVGKALRNLKLEQSPRRWNTWLTLIWRVRNPTAPSGRVLHPSVCNILRRTPFFLSGTTVQSWTQESHAKRREASGSMILLFSGWASLSNLYVVQERAHLKCPHIPVRKGTKNFLGSSGIASTGRKDCPSSYSISWHSPWKSQMWRKSLEEGSGTRSPTSQLCVCNQKLLLMGPDTTNPIFFPTPFPIYNVDSMFLLNLILFQHFGYSRRTFIRALLKASAMERKAKPT